MLSASKLLKKARMFALNYFRWAFEKLCRFPRCLTAYTPEFKDCSVTSSFIRFVILSYASSIHSWSIIAAPFFWISHWFRPCFSWFRWYVFQFIFCFLEDAAIRKIESSLVHELFHIQLRFSFVHKNYHSFLRMIPFNVDLVTFFGQYVQGWVHRGFSFYFSILFSTEIEFILYSDTLHSRAKRWLWMWQARSMYKPCKKPLLLLIAFIPPQSRDQGLMELLHRSSIACLVFGRSSPFGRLCGGQQMVRKKQDAEKAKSSVYARCF